MADMRTEERPVRVERRPCYREGRRVVKLNPYQWDSAGRGRARGTTEGVQAERFHGGVTIKVTIGGTYMGVDLTTEQADDLSKFLIDHGIAERAAEGDDS